MKRTALACLLLLLYAAPVRAASDPRGDSTWKLSADFFPHGTSLVHPAATNKNMQYVFGSDHTISYSDLQRINGRGWLEQAVRSHDGQIDFGLAYGVSYFPSSLEANATVADLARTLGQTTLLEDVGEFGRSFDGPADGGYYLNFTGFGAGAVTVEIACFVRLSERAKYGRTVDRFCAREREALVEILAGEVTSSSG